MQDFERRLLMEVQNTGLIMSAARKDKRIIEISPFAYNPKITALGAGATDQAIAQIQADSDFVMVYMSAMALDTTGPTVVLNALALMQVTDTGSGRTYFDNPTLLPLVFGQQGFPYILPTPRVITENTNVQVEAQNISAATTYDIYLSFVGIRIFYGG